MILEPVNDSDCLRQLLRLAREIAMTAEARQLVGELGSMGKVEEAIRNRPSLPDDGKAKGDATVQCDVVQRSRFWAPQSNCFEDTLDFVVANEVLSPNQDVTAITFRLPGGELHTAPVVDPYGPGSRVVILSHRVRDKIGSAVARQIAVAAPPSVSDAARDVMRDVDNPEIGKAVGTLDSFLQGAGPVKSASRRPTSVPPVRNAKVKAKATPWWKTGFGYVHEVGGAVLTGFGLGGVAAGLGQLEQDNGLLPGGEQPEDTQDQPGDGQGANDGQGQEGASPQQRRGARQGADVRSRRRGGRNRRAGRGD